MPMPGNNLFSIDYLDTVVKDDIPNLSHAIRPAIKRAIETRLTIDPIGYGKPLRYSLKGHRRLRVGDYRIVYRIDIQNHKVIIVAIKHRKEIYCDA